MRIIGGIYKGKTIPFTNSRYNDADITSQIVKEAVFDIISRRIKGAVFLDLFSCSGQIGLEAVSRGASYVRMNEHDKKRFSFIRRMVTDMEISDICSVTPYDSKKVINECASSGIAFDIIYLDPPYFKSHGNAPVYTDILKQLSDKSLLKDDGIIVVQHFSGNTLPDEVDHLFKTDSRKYGQNSLTFYEKQCNVPGN